MQCTGNGVTDKLNVRTDGVRSTLSVAKYFGAYQSTTNGKIDKEESQYTRNGVKNKGNDVVDGEDTTILNGECFGAY